MVLGIAGTSLLTAGLAAMLTREEQQDETAAVMRQLAAPHARPSRPLRGAS